MGKTDGTPRSASSGQETQGTFSLQKEIAQLRALSFTDSEAKIQNLKGEVEALKGQLKSKDEVTMDVHLIKLLLKNNIRYAEEKNNEQILAMKTAMEAINVSELENKTNGELALLKKELTSIKEQLKKRDEEDQTRAEIANLKTDVLEQLKVAEGKTKDELHKMMQSVETMANKAEYEQTQQELEKVKEELHFVKEELKETEKASKVRLELITLKKSLEMELWNSQGMNKQEIKAIKAAIKKIDKKSIENKSFDELSVIRKDVQQLKEEIKTKEETAAVKEELDELKLKVSRLLHSSEGKTKEEMLAYDCAIDSLSVRQQNVTDSSDMEDLRAELAELRQQMADKEEAHRIKQELSSIKASLQSEIVEAKQRNNEAFDVLRETFASLKAVESNATDSAIEDLITEVKKLKEEVEEQNRANHELAVLQRELTGKLDMLDSDDEDNENLMAVKNAVDAVAAFDADEDSELLMDELTSLKGSIKEAEASVKSAKDLEVVKYALEKKLQSTDGKSKVQLEEIISVVEKIDVESLGGNHSALKEELGATKRALKSRELYSALSKLEILFKSTRCSRAETRRIREEIAHIKAEAETQSLVELEESLQKVLAMQAELEAKSENKKEKKGLRKFFSSLVGRRNEKKSSSGAVSIGSTADSGTSSRNQKGEVFNEVAADHDAHGERAPDNAPEELAAEVKEALSGSVRSRASAARSKRSSKSKGSVKGSVKSGRHLEQAGEKVNEGDKTEEDQDSGPPAVVSLDMSETGSVVSRLSRLSKPYGDATSGVIAEKAVEEQRDENEIIGNDKEKDSQSQSSKRSKRSMRSAMSKKSAKSSSSKKSSTSNKETIGMSEKVKNQESSRAMSMSKTGMPPLYPTKQMYRAEPEHEDEEEHEHDEVYDERDANEEFPDDDVLDNISVAMTNRNEAGELDVETIVEPSNSLVVPLTMSI